MSNDTLNNSKNRHGSITGVTRGGVDLRTPSKPSPGQVERYGLCYPFQVGPRTAAAFCNLSTTGYGHWDYEDGSDLALFDKLDDLGKVPLTPVCRNETEPDQATGGTRVIVKYPVAGGFVPLGARNARGLAHPHAGTGFAICTTRSYLTDDQGYYHRLQEYIHRNEFRQCSYDGVDFRVGAAVTYTETEPLAIGRSGWWIDAWGLSNPVPAGDDLLAPLAARNAKKVACGVCRWRHEAGEWRPVTFVPIADGSEPSLIRDMDGALLFAVRGEEIEGVAVRVWRSTDDGQAWTKIIDMSPVCDRTPISINRAVDGTPYIAANRYGDYRAKLCLWPLNKERNGLLDPIMIRDCAADFGPPPGDALWFADHPISAILRLADDALHSVLTYRVMTFSHKDRGQEHITPATGTYIEEVTSTGSPLPIWE